ncbi:hypothetical protein DL89DRAFT_264917 [Linderina pennispora]|uniref:Uncharacterized protein n=1 Tax=Linderina pennispora TaxID=61395 RepID=A0A1Y1WHK2_9FUNG|nr:uncharacterized protein DL89DRAFT_264917 [Linderina pennispora]ORX72716.1 hypothetical protein DL89DRAFT_264917 [Linderina pennispora]
MVELLDFKTFTNILSPTRIIMPTRKRIHCTPDDIKELLGWLTIPEHRMEETHQLEVKHHRLELAIVEHQAEEE